MDNQNTRDNMPRPISSESSPQPILSQNNPVSIGQPQPLEQNDPSQSAINPPPQSPINPPTLEEENGGRIKKFIIIAFGILGVLFLVFLVITFILPKLGESKKVTLTYWGLWEDPQIFSGVISEFERDHPNIEIKYEKKDIKAEGKYIERLSTRIQNGTGPDIFRFHISWIPELKSMLLPFSNNLVNDINFDNYYNTVKDDAKENSAYYGVPLETDNLALFINNDLFEGAGIENPPSTWDDVVKISRQLTVKDEEGNITTSGISLGTYDNIEHASDLLSLLFIQNGADMKDLAGKNRQNSEDALSFYTSFARGDNSVWNSDMDNSKTAFIKGNLAMYFGYSWDILEIKASNPSLNFKIVKVPSLPSKKTTVASYWLEGVSMKTKFQKESFEFLKFLSQNSTLEKLYAEESKTRLFGEIYPKKDMKDLLSSNEYLGTFLDQASDAESTIFASNTYDDAMVSSLNAYLANAVRSVQDDSVTASSAIDTLAAGVDQVLGRYSNSFKK